MVVVPHSMVIIYFLHFLKWVEAPPPRGGGGDPGWCAKHIIKGNMNIGPVFLSVPKTISNMFSAEAKDVASIRVKVQLVGFQAASSSMDGFKALEERRGYDCKFETATRSCNSRYSSIGRIDNGLLGLASIASSSWLASWRQQYFELGF
ncbi:hypothetical protein OIU76_015678 [Salix suchowensis]|nr:hypothetical protein OIU76_015678 [Salix suchowensis]